LPLAVPLKLANKRPLKVSTGGRLVPNVSTVPKAASSCDVDSGPMPKRADTASLLTVGAPSSSTLALAFALTVHGPFHRWLPAAIHPNAQSNFGMRLRGEFDRCCRTALHHPAALSISAGDYYSPSQPFSAAPVHECTCGRSNISFLRLYILPRPDVNMDSSSTLDPLGEPRPKHGFDRLTVLGLPHSVVQ